MLWHGGSEGERPIEPALTTLWCRSETGVKHSTATSTMQLTVDRLIMNHLVSTARAPDIILLYHRLLAMAHPIFSTVFN